MLKVARRIMGDLRERRHIESYVVAAAAFVIAVLSVLDDVVPDGEVKENLRWTVVLAGVGILVFGMTLPEPDAPTSLDAHLHDRSRFDEEPLSKRLGKAREVCIYAPSAVNILSTHYDLLRRTILARPDGSLRVVVLDPGNENAVRHAERHIDDAVDFQARGMRESLATTLGQLEVMGRWQVPGSVSWRLAEVNPGFSLVGIDMDTSSGVVIVEFHGVRNVASSGRMHLEITRKSSERWYAYWVDQFEAIWNASRPPGAVTGPDNSIPAPRTAESGVGSDSQTQA
jgi:hypothetical protein